MQIVVVGIVAVEVAEVEVEEVLWTFESSSKNDPLLSHFISDILSFPGTRTTLPPFPMLLSRASRTST